MRIVGASSRAARRSPTTSGLPSPIWTSSTVPPARSTCAAAHSAARRRSAGSPPPVEIDGMRSHSMSGSRRSGTDAAICHTAAPRWSTVGMVRRVLFIVVALGLLAGAAAIAIAQTGSSTDAYQLQEPSIASRHVIRLPSDQACVHFTRVTVRFLPPPGAVFGVFEVRTDGAEAARLTGVPRAASATVRLNGARTTVRVTGTTLGAEVVHAAHSYRRCVSRG